MTAAFRFLSSVVAASHAAFLAVTPPSHAAPTTAAKAVVFVAAPSHGAGRFMAASAGGMRCRPYNCTTTLDFFLDWIPDRGRG